VTDYGLDDLWDGVRVPIGSIVFTSSPDGSVGLCSPPIQWIREALDQEVKRPGREADDIQNAPLLPRNEDQAVRP
jgi:hypothetical protein